MNTKDLIGKTITDIFVWSKIEICGLEEAAVFIELENHCIVGIPWDFDSENLERDLKKGAKSLFADLRDIQVEHVNQAGKTIEEVRIARRKSASTFVGWAKSTFGFTEEIPKEYQPYKTEFIENKLRHLRNQKIVDFLMVHESDEVGFLELENGYIITETTMSPYGTGMAGLNYFQSLTEFEECFGTDYERLIDKGDKS